MRVANIQRFCMHDGPGIRTTVFLKGCPLRCAWCHNPETQSADKEILFFQNKCIGCGGCNMCPANAHFFSDKHIFDRSLCVFCNKCIDVCPTGTLEICGKDYTAYELLDITQKDTAFYGNTGGVTLSGGEPFLQAKDALALLKLCKTNGIHTAVETCGYFSPDILKYAISLTDLFLWDIKDTDSNRHKKYTGVSNERIIKNLFLADQSGANTRLRCILVNNISKSKYSSQSSVFLETENTIYLLERIESSALQSETT